jgi:hypothetical protein
MRGMFDPSRRDTIILHAVTVRLGLQASGGPQWLTCEGEDPRYSSCKCVVPVLDWKGRRAWTRPRGMGYMTPSELREALEGAREAFPEIAWEDLKVAPWT